MNDFLDWMPLIKVVSRTIIIVSVMIGISSSVHSIANYANDSYENYQRYKFKVIEITEGCRTPSE